MNSSHNDASAGHRRWGSRLLLCAICVALGAAFAVEMKTSAAETGRATIRVTTRQIDVSSVDAGRRGRSPGDLTLTTARVYNTRITQKPIGSFELVCTFVRTSSRACRGTVQLPRGYLVVAGAMRYRPLYELAVTGGTGLYNNARGTLTVTRLGTRPTRDLLLVRLVG